MVIWQSIVDDIVREIPHNLWIKTIFEWMRGEEDEKKHIHTNKNKNDASNNESRLPWTHNFIGFNNENKWFGSDVLKTLCKWTKFHSKHKQSNQIHYDDTT